MTTPTIEALPPAPQRSQPPADLSNAMDRFAASLPPFAMQMNDAIGWIDGTLEGIAVDRQRAEEAAESAAGNAEQTTDDKRQTGEDRQAAGQAATSAGKDAAQTAADRIQTGEDRTATGQYRNEALQYRNEAQQIAAGDIAITDLQPGTLTTEKDYASVDTSGAVVKRNLAADIDEQMNSGEQSANLSRYNVALVTTSSAAVTLDFSAAQDYTLTGDGSTRTITFANLPNTDRGMVAVMTLAGQATTAPIVWPDNCIFMNSDGTAPEQFSEYTEASRLVFTLKWDGLAVQVYSMGTA